MARSYIKIYGPPVAKALRALEQVAVEMSKKTTMRYYNPVTVPALTVNADPEEYENQLLPTTNLPTPEKIKLISTATQAIGEYDFFFEWGTEPTLEQVNELITKIDAVLEKCGCMYTITTK